MVDRDAAARFPDPAYTCRQASSYDRASVSPEKPATWWANNDNSFFIRSEQNGGREEWVMMDAEGPGCIVRWWITSGNPIGNIRVYLDGQKEPVITMPAKDADRRRRPGRAPAVAAAGPGHATSTCPSPTPSTAR